VVAVSCAYDTETRETEAVMPLVSHFIFQRGGKGL
jgi:hypothetical protein